MYLSDDLSCVSSYQPTSPILIISTTGILTKAKTYKCCSGDAPPVCFLQIGTNCSGHVLTLLVVSQIADDWFLWYYTHLMSTKCALRKRNIDGCSCPNFEVLVMSSSILMYAQKPDYYVIIKAHYKVFWFEAKYYVRKPSTTITYTETPRHIKHRNHTYKQVAENDDSGIVYRGT